jgi:hypothetical protein
MDSDIIQRAPLSRPESVEGGRRISLWFTEVTFVIPDLIGNPVA